jgi:hypothetical protein
MGGQNERSRPPILKLVCQGACGLGGQDWEGPHRVVGRLVLGHTALVRVGRVGSTVHFEDSTADGASAGLLGQTPPRTVMRLGQFILRTAPLMVRQPDYWVRPHPGLSCGSG